MDYNLKEFSMTTINENQLQHMCRVSQARWIANVQCIQNTWQVTQTYGLSKKRFGMLSAYLDNSTITTWISGALTSGRTRTRNLGADAKAMGVQKLFLFPAENSNQVLLVGADDLEKLTREWFRNVQMYSPIATSDNEETGTFSFSWGQDVSSEKLSFVISSMIRENSLSALAKNITQKLYHLFGLDGVYLFFGETQLRLLGAAPHQKPAQPVQEIDGFRESLKNGQAYFLGSAADFGDQKTYQQDSVYLSVPLRDRDEFLGTLDLIAKPGTHFSESFIHTIILFADNFVVCAARLQRVEELKETARHLEAIRETSLDVTEMGLEAVLSRSLERACDLVNAKGGELGLVGEKEEIIRILVSKVPWGERFQYAMSFGEGIAGRVAKSGKPLIVDSYSTWRGRVDKDRPVKFHAAVGVPLHYKGDVIGVLVLMDDDKRRTFKEEDVRMLEILAPQISVSIRNVHLFRELSEKVKVQQVTERRLVETARLAAIGEMAASVAHELNNPLTTISGFTELVMHTLPEGSAERQDLELVLKEARRSRDVVRRLLDYSRRDENLKRPIDLNEVLGEVVMLVHPIGQSQGVHIRYESWDLPEIFADRDQLKQVILNLIYNGLQAMPQGGSLLLETAVDIRDKKEWVVLRVEDTGKGISADIQKQIFEPFYTTKPIGMGTGLGLSISKNIITEHNGYIEVDSPVEKKGAVFSVWLPIMDGK